MLATGIVPGGGVWAQAQRAGGAGATVQPGDAIIGVADGSGAVRVRTEGASFDEVVAAIGRVRERSSTIRLSVKRLVKRGVAKVRGAGLPAFGARVVWTPCSLPPKTKWRQVTARLADGREIEYEAYDGENLRMGLLSRGQKVNDPMSQRWACRYRRGGRGRQRSGAPSGGGASVTLWSRSPLARVRSAQHRGGRTGAGGFT